MSDERRVGKTTVAFGAFERFAEAGGVVGLLDLSMLAEGRQLAQELARQVAAQRGHVAAEVEGVRAFVRAQLRRLREVHPPDVPQPEHPQTTDAALDLLDSALSGAEAIESALTGAEELARSRQTRVAILLDEVQLLASWTAREEIERSIHRRLRGTDRRTSYCFTGSDASLRETLLGAGGLLERDGIDFKLSAIDHQQWQEGLTRSFGVLEMTVEPAAIDEIVAATDGRPLRTMLVAARCHFLATRRQSRHLDPNLAALGVEDARHQRQWEQG